MGAGTGAIGIAGINSLLAINNPPGADGDFVLFVRSSAGMGSGTLTIPFTLPTAANSNPRDWRLCFLGAQRLQGTVPDRQVIRIEVTIGTATTTVFEDSLRDQTFRRHLTRPFVAPASTSGTPSNGQLRIIGLAAEAAEQVGFLDLLQVREVRDFSQASTWTAASVPTSTSDVAIGPDSCVGLRAGHQVNTVDLTGELIALEGSTISLQTRWIKVHTPTAFLQVGTEGVPFTSAFELRLDDDALSSGEDVAALHVYDRATVDLHGIRRPAWLRAEYVWQDIAEFATNPGWLVGDEIVIAPSTRRFDQEDQRCITAIELGNQGGVKLVLDSFPAHSHAGTRQQIHGSLSQVLTLDQRPEVGLLTHNIKVMSVLRPSGVPGLGGHILIQDKGAGLAGPSGVGGGFGRFSNVELKGLGRRGQLGRYPIHWHFLLDQGRGQFMKRCSIRDSNNRVVAVHATDFVLFEGNVGYRHPGHGVLIEDGGEENNQFIGNLILGTRVPDVGFGLLLSDSGPNDKFQNRAPASFWITSPNNVFIGNVAAGSQGTGYWFAVPKERMGMTASRESAGTSGNPVVRNYFRPNGNARPAPNRRPLGAFQDNVCHSSWLAIDINDGIDLATTAIDTNLTWQPQGPTGSRIIASLDRFVAYSCNVGLYTGNGDRNLQFVRAIVSDTTWSVALASHDLVTDSAIVLDSGNGLWPAAVPPTSGNDQPAIRTAVILYDGAAEMRDVSLFGYDTTSAGGSPVAAFRTEGAARRRNNIPYSGFYCFSSLASATEVWTNVSGIQDAGVVPTSFPNNSPLDPRHWAFSIDNFDLSMGTLASSTEDPIIHPTIVARHPMMLTGNESGSTYNEIDLPASGSPARMLYSPHRFAFVRVFGGTQRSVSSMTAFRHADLKYERRHGNGVTPPMLVYMDRWSTDPYHQMALIADRAGEDNRYRYLTSWWTHSSSGVPTVVAPAADTEIQVSSLHPNDSVLLGLAGYSSAPAAVNLANNYDEFGNPMFGVPVPVVALNQLGPQVAQTSTAFDAAAGVVWVRVKIPSANAPLVNLQGDGIGQAIQVLR